QRRRECRLLLHLQCQPVLVNPISLIEHGRQSAALEYFPSPDDCVIALHWYRIVCRGRGPEFRALCCTSLATHAHFESPGLLRHRNNGMPRKARSCCGVSQSVSEQSLCRTIHKSPASSTR